MKIKQIKRIKYGIEALRSMDRQFIQEVLITNTEEDFDRVNAVSWRQVSDFDYLTLWYFIPRLEVFIKYVEGTPNDILLKYRKSFNLNDDDYTSDLASAAEQKANEEWTNILKTMLKAFEYKYYLKSNVGVKPTESMKITIEKGFKYFSKYFDSLWI